MESLKALWEGKIDFRGQSLADRIQQEGLVLAAAIAYVVGSYFQSLALCIYVFGIGFLAVLVACVPPWPFYNRYPPQWLPNLPKSDGKADVRDEAEENKED